LRPSSTKTAVLPPAAVPRKAAIAASAPPGAQRTAETLGSSPPSPAPAAKAAPAARGETGPRPSSRGKGHRSSADLVRDIASKAGVDREPAAGPTEKAAPTTPAELKNPFGNP
jgi:hypothetical protein